MEETYSGLQDLGAAMDAAQTQVANLGQKLSGVVQLMLLLVR